jgi:hypothetical protein
MMGANGPIDGLEKATEMFKDAVQPLFLQTVQLLVMICSISWFLYLGPVSNLNGDFSAATVHQQFPPLR